MASDKGKLTKLLITDNGGFPNNGELPLIIYKNAVALSFGEDAASQLEAVFSANGWVNAWRNGVYDYHHYHSTAHEVLGIYEGEVDLQTGGPGGKITRLKKGDVVVIPAGVAHKNEGSSEDFKCVGAYPTGQDYDMNYGKAGERPGVDANIQNVPLPVMDPVYGKDGPLISEWTGGV